MKLLDGERKGQRGVIVEEGPAIEHYDGYSNTKESICGKSRVEFEDGTMTIFAPPAEFFKAKSALLEAFPGLELEIQEITFIPQSTTTLSGENLVSFEKLQTMLNDCDDVQEIYHNVSLPS